MSTVPDPAEFQQLYEDLRALHGPVERDRDRGDGVRQLLGTILSQNVTSENTRRALSNLEATYASYRAIETAELEELAEVIRPAGLPETKARRLQNALEHIRLETGGEYTLAFLDDMPTSEAKSWLEEIKGVGPKTASVVLNFQFDAPTFAVDTHIHRIAQRYGFVPEGTSPERTQELLDPVIPDELKYELHTLLIQHGREYCTARNPDYDNPVSQRYCERCDDSQ